MVKYRWRFQFKLRTLFLMTFYLGVALAVGRVTKDWWSGLDAIVAVAAVIGLTQQIVELMRFSGAQRSSPVPNRGAVGLAIAWRAALVVFLEFAFFGQHFKELQEQTSIGFAPSTINFAYQLFLVVALNTKPITPRAHTRGGTVIGLLGIVAFAIWFWFVWMDWGVITSLVHIAIEGIMLNQRRSVMDQHFLGAATRSEYDAHHLTLIIVTTIALAELLLTLLLLFLIARMTSRYPRWLRVLLIIGALVGFAAIAGTLYWIEFYGIRMVSPLIAANRLNFEAPLPQLIFPAMIVITGVTAFTHRFLGHKASNGPVWTNRKTFANEHWIIALVILSRVPLAIIDAIRAIDNEFFYYITLPEIFYDPSSMLSFALLVTAIRNLYRAFVHRRSPPIERRLLQSSKWFYFIWTCLLLCTLATGPIVLWSSFAYWTDARIPPDFLMPED